VPNAPHPVIEPQPTRYRSAVAAACRSLRRLGVLFAAWLLLSAPAGAVTEQSGEVTVRVVFDYLVDQTGDSAMTDVQQEWTVTLQFRDRGHIQSSIMQAHRGHGRRALRYGEETDLGQEGEQTSWHVVNASTVQGRLKWGKDALMQITVKLPPNQSTCNAEVKLLGPNGGKTFTLLSHHNSRLSSFTNFRLTGVTCTAELTP